VCSKRPAVLRQEKGQREHPPEKGKRGRGVILLAQAAAPRRTPGETKKRKEAHASSKEEGKKEAFTFYVNRYAVTEEKAEGGRYDRLRDYREKERGGEGEREGKYLFRLVKGTVAC